MATLSFQPIKVRTGSPDEEGVLVFADAHLVALLIRLSALHEDLEGHWYMELAMALRGSRPGQVFASLDHAGDWIAAHI